MERHVGPHHLQTAIGRGGHCDARRTPPAAPPRAIEHLGHGGASMVTGFYGKPLRLRLLRMDFLVCIESAMQWIPIEPLGGLEANPGQALGHARAYLFMQPRRHRMRPPQPSLRSSRLQCWRLFSQGRFIHGVGKYIEPCSKPFAGQAYVTFVGPGPARVCAALA